MCADRRIGILGGTFDPVHLGHLASAREVAAAHVLDRVLLVLSARPPHKSGGEDAAADDMRWRMLRLAVEESRRRYPDAAVLEASDLELRRSGPSFTVDTLRELQALHPAARLFLILGIDAYDEVDTWSRPGELLELASVIVTSRPGCDFTPGAVIPPVASRSSATYDSSIGGHVHTSGHTLRGHRIGGIEVSATDIRDRVRAGLPVAHLTGEDVARFIHEHALYGAGAANAGPDAARAGSDAVANDSGSSAHARPGETKHWKH
jgi:nicotinate-nucleotide adenylyltransferase